MEAPADSRRTEQVFLSHTYRWLKPGGVLVLVIPGDRLAECSQILASHFRDVRVYRLEAPECVRYKQVVVLGVRRNRRERERMHGLRHHPWRDSNSPAWQETPHSFPFCLLNPTRNMTCHRAGQSSLLSRGLPLDEIEDLLPQSAAYRQAGTHSLCRSSAAIRGDPSHLFTAATQRYLAVQLLVGWDLWIRK